MSRKNSAKSAPAASNTEGVGLQEGLVVGSHGRHCVVESADGNRRICHPRGKKNQALVGDRVLWLPAPPGQGEEGSIEKVQARRNLLYRQDEIRTKSFAANIDQVLILIAAEPVFSESQLARALIAAEAAGIPPIIALYKSDLTAPFAQAWERLAACRWMTMPVRVWPSWSCSSREIRVRSRSWATTSRTCGSSSTAAAAASRSRTSPRSASRARSARPG